MLQMAQLLGDQVELHALVCISFILVLHADGVHHQ